MQIHSKNTFISAYVPVQHKNTSFRGNIISAASRLCEPAPAARAHLFERTNFVRLPENIQYSLAKTIDEAKSFAENIFKVKRFLIKDLAFANYTNKALEMVSNFHRGELFMPRVLFQTPDLWTFKGAYYGKRRIIGLNHKEILNIERHIGRDSNNFKYPNGKSLWFESPRNRNQYDMDLRLFNNDELDAFEKLEFYANQLRLTKISDKLLSEPQVLLLECFNNPVLAEYLAKNGITKDNSGLITRAHIPQIIGLISEWCLRNNQSLTFSELVVPSHPLNVLLHEMGHMQHICAVGRKKKYQKLSKSESEIASRVMPYKCLFYNAHEFIADAYAALAGGIKLPKEVKNLYVKFDGPIPKHLKSNFLEN